MYDLDKCLGKGTYGTVFKGTDIQNRKVVALKTQKPAWVWEYYISREIKTRLTNPHMVYILCINIFRLNVFIKNLIIVKLISVAWFYGCSDLLHNR